MRQDDNGGKPSGSDRFTQTRWSQVLLAGQGDADTALVAKEQLCRIYWRPIYSFVRRTGKSPHDAEDLAQQFFLKLLGNNTFSNADPSKGRFRSFLLGALKHFLMDENRKAATQKRGGEFAFAPLDLTEAEESYLLDPNPELTAEQVYDRRWAATLLDRAFQVLRDDFANAEQLDRFEILKVYLSGETSKGDYQVVAQRLGMTNKAVGVAVSRLRQRYRQLIRKEVADTLGLSGDVDKELRELFG